MRRHILATSIDPRFWDSYLSDGKLGNGVFSCWSDVHPILDDNGRDTTVGVFNKIMLAGAFAIGVATTASAATLSINDGVTGSIPGGTDGGGASTNHVLDNVLGISTLGGYFESFITLSEDATIHVELMGYEAGAENSFTLGGNSVNGGGGADYGTLTSPLDAFNVATLAGTLEFIFESDLGGGRDVENGSDNDGAWNFFASFGPGMEDATSGTVLWLFFDDAGGIAPGDIDDNHDDLVVRISVVPLPAGAVLLLTGLGGLAIARRRRTA